MKKLLIATFVIGTVAVATSCKKDHVCECTVWGFTADTTLADMSKKDAQDECDNLSNAAAIAGGSCELE